MATYIAYTPISSIAKAMFNFDLLGVAEHKLSGTVRVSVSDSFSYSDYLSPGYSAFYQGIYTSGSNEMPWTTQMTGNIQNILGIYSQFANITFEWKGDYDTFTSGGDSTVNPEDVGRANISDINITWIDRSDVDFSGISGGNTDLWLEYIGSAGDIFLNAAEPQFAEDFTLDLDTSARQTLMHELGHSLGLSHPHSGFSNGIPTITADYAATQFLGFWQLGFRTSSAADMYKEYFTIMSYDDQQYYYQAHTPMILDVIALQQAYGEGAGTSGGGNDTIAAGTIGYRTYFDKGGTDTIDLALYSTTDGAYLKMGVNVTGAAHMVGVAMSLYDANSTLVLGGDPGSLRWFYGEYENAAGSSSSDVLVGNALNNEILGLTGDDYLDGSAGNDTIVGGVGNDSLSGGGGNDSLTGDGGRDVFSYATSANGIDVITDFNFDDSIQIDGAALSGTIVGGTGATVGNNQVQFSSSGGTTTLYVGTNATAGADVVINLAGTYLGTQLLLNGDRIGVRPVDSRPTGTLNVTGSLTEDQTVSVTDTLADVDGLGGRSYTWQSSSDGSAWAAFGTGNSVTLGDAQVGKQIRITANYTDGQGYAESVTGQASTQVANINDIPNLQTPLQDGQYTVSGTDYRYSIAGNAFIDVDPGDYLTYSVSLANDDPLPTWLAFNPATRTFFGTATGADVGTLQVRVTATDNSATSVSDSFDLHVLKANGAPVATNGLGFGGAEDSPLSGTLTASDEDLDPLTYSLDTSAGHGQVTVNPNGGFDYRPDPDYSGPDSFVFRVSDGRGGVDLASVSLTVTAVNDAPSTPGASLRVVRSDTYSGTLTASDPENDPLAFSVQAAPTQGDLILNGDGSFSYTAHADAGPDSFNYLVDDGQGGSTAGTVLIESGTPVDTHQTGTPFDDILNGRIRNDTLSGLGGNDLLNGFAGNDLLNGGSGIDTLIGGAGDDTYLVDTPLDQIVEQAGAGVDTVLAYGDTALSAHLETLLLLGADLDGRGNAGANLILGSYGANRLDGAGGADTLVGGTGNDTYVIDQAGDLIIENPYQGEDSVESSISYTLGTGLEHLSLTGGADLDASGNGADNRLTGNAGANRLAGGDGRDTLAGAGGDDTYFIDGDDVVSEDLTAGNDTIHFMVTRPDQVYQLGANLENLVLDGSLAGNGVGNALDNRLTGNAEGNVLVGLGGNDRLDGGAGADLLMGGAGSDTYVVDHGADRIKGETATGGTDVVFSSVSYILPNHVEELHLTGWAHVNATGNNQNNVLVGNGGRNVLTGGLGNDSFVFDSLGGQPDRIADFSLLHDQILFETDVFTGIAFGALDVSAFASGAHYTAAQDASDRLICDTWNGYLYYDADGLGGTAAIQVAVLDPGLALTLMPSSFAGF
jgi:Ca2+-binding RTX toxin-like protein